MANRHRFCPIEEVHEYLWPGSNFEGPTRVPTHVERLNQKLALEEDEFRIGNVRKVGYFVYHIKMTQGYPVLPE